MQAIVNRDHLMRCLRAVNQTAAHSFLGNWTLVSVEEDGYLRVSLTGLHMAAHAWCPVRDAEPGMAIVSSKALSDWVSLMRGEILLADEDQSLKAVSGKSQAWFRKQSEIPTRPPLRVEKTFPIGHPEVIGRVTLAVARQEDRPILTGVFVRVTDSAMILAACDGYRLSEIRTPLDGGPSEPIAVVVPHLDRIQNIADILDARVSVGMAEKWVVFCFEGEEIRAQTEISALEGRYPDYEPLIPKEDLALVKATIPTADFLRALRTVRVVAGEEGTVRITITRGDSLNEDAVMEIAAPNNSGVTRMNISAACQQDRTTIFVSGDWVAQALKEVEDPLVSLRLHFSDTPIVLAVDSWKYLVMPRRGSEEQ
ncbi:MAG: hypothetical protein J7575_01800 [Chloroflexi bacterium]|nr:hypothetical protein [Chloroflexota bacterium]